MASAPQDIRQQCDGLDVAVFPAVIRERNDPDSALAGGIRHGGCRRAHGKGRWMHAGRKGMVTFRSNTPGYLQINCLVATGIVADQLREYLLPFRSRQGVSDADGIQAVLKSFQVPGEAEKFPAVHRDDFINTIAEQESPVHNGDAHFLQWPEGAVQIGNGHGCYSK
jgi:hypothetical protein